VLSLSEIINHFLSTPHTDIQKHLSQKRARQWILSVKRKFRKNNEFLTVVYIDPEGMQLYGLVTSEEDAETAFHLYYKRASGIVNSMQQLHKTVQSKHLLSSRVKREPLMLPHLKGEK
jgi:hypothetical protein